MKQTNCTYRNKCQPLTTVLSIFLQIFHILVQLKHHETSCQVDAIDCPIANTCPTPAALIKRTHLCAGEVWLGVEGQLLYGAPSQGLPLALRGEQAQLFLLLLAEAVAIANLKTKEHQQNCAEKAQIVYISFGVPFPVYKKSSI